MFFVRDHLHATMIQRQCVLGLVTLFLLNCSQLYAQAEGQFGAPSALVGGAGTAGDSTVDSLSLNPAHAGDADQSEVHARWGYASISYSQRYPGFEAHSSSKAGLQPALPFPGVLYKFNRRLGIGGIIIPFPVKKEIDVRQLPIVILGQQNSVDIEGTGQLSALVDMSIGYSLSPMLAMGLTLNYQAIKGDGALIPSGSSAEPLATFAVATATTAVGFGLKFSQPKYSLAISTRVFEMVSNKTQFDSQISKPEDREAAGDGQSTSSSLFNPIRIGIDLRPVQRLSLLADMSYRRASKDLSRFSVVDFKEKPLDVHDTFSFYSGISYQQASNLHLLGGYQNEPSSVGEGSKGKDGQSGFGFFDLAMGMGAPPSKPVWGVGGGARYEFDRIITKKNQKPRYRMAVEGGLVYSETSIGIGADGEQPGAYLVKRYHIPLRFAYRF